MKHHRERKPLQTIKLELVNLGASKSQIAKPEVKELSKMLFEDEVIKSFITGFYDGGYAMLVATDIRMIFVDVMILGRTIVDDVPYTSINAVELQLGIFLASVNVIARSKNYRFWWLNKNQASDFSDYVERQMLKHFNENVKV